MSRERRFAALVHQHQRRAYNAAFRILGDRESATDVLQDACLSLYERLDAVEEAWAGAWLARVATNRALDVVRRRRREAESSPTLARLAPVRGPGETTDDREERDRIARAIDQLSPRQREVVLLRIYEELPFREIAGALGISEGATKVHYRRGLEALRLLLARRATSGESA